MSEPAFRCVVHGSFGRHFEQIREAIELFKSAHITVLAPKSSEITAIKDTFLLLENEENVDPREVELQYLHNLLELGQNGFSYFVNPGGYIGRSAAYELGIAQALNVPCYFSHKPRDLPVYVPSSHIISAENLAEYINKERCLPTASVFQKKAKLHQLMQKLARPGSVVAAGAIIEYKKTERSMPEVLLVKTHKWGNRYSVVGGKVKHGEKLHQTLLREIQEETGLKAQVGEHIATFDQLTKSGYYQDWVHHMFVDYVAQVQSKKVRLNEEAQDYIWLPAQQALAELTIEPNAKLTLQEYVGII